MCCRPESSSPRVEKIFQDCIQIVYNLYMIIPVYKLYTVTVYNLYTILKDFFHVGRAAARRRTLSLQPHVPK